MCPSPSQPACGEVAAAAALAWTVAPLVALPVPVGVLLWWRHGSYLRIVDLLLDLISLRRWRRSKGISRTGSGSSRRWRRGKRKRVTDTSTTGGGSSRKRRQQRWREDTGCAGIER
nr:unnamed protein product [Digitaria exilis]